MAVCQFKDSPMSTLSGDLKSAALLAAVIVATLAVAAGAVAEDSPKARASVLQALVDCRTITDPTLRLGCYDAAAGRLQAAEATGEVVVVDRAQVQEAQRAAFGFNFRMPSFLTVGGDANASKAPDGVSQTSGVIDSLESAVVSFRKLNGRWIIRLPDGALWVQTDDTILVRDPKPGSKVIIKRGAMGGYFLSVDGQRSMRARREN
jgi:hypothetical protein